MAGNGVMNKVLESQNLIKHGVCNVSASLRKDKYQPTVLKMVVIAYAMVLFST